MGVLVNTKQFITSKVASAAKKAGDGIATLSALSPKQLQELENKRNKYLGAKPDLTGEETRNVIEKNMGAIGIEVYQAYLEQLSTIYQPVDAMLDDFDEDNRIRFFDISKWVTDSEEQSLNKLVNVYHVLSEEDCNIALIYHRTRSGCRVSIGVANTNDRLSDPAIADKYYSRVVSAIKGNFPGANIEGMNSKERDYGVGIPGCLASLDDDDITKSIAIVSNVASEKSEDFISQSMEKLLDGIVPESDLDEYTIVLLAKPIREQLESKNRLYELYTSLAPYSSWQTGYTYTELDGVSSSANFGVNLGVSAGAHSVVNSSIGTSESTGTSAGVNASVNFGVSFARSSSVTAQVGKNESISQTYTNYGIKHTLEIIESQLKRIEESSALGMWEFASYVISENPIIANNVAHMYLALTQGEESYLTKASVNFWDGGADADAAKTIIASVQKLQHPVFGLKTSLEDEWLMYPTLVTPTTPLSGKELARALNFPRKSVSGMPVIECVAFGREVHKYEVDESEGDVISFGHTYHMHHDEKEDVMLDTNSLTSHTFITGSTGTGKSNTVYQLIEKIRSKGVHFMIIEPAKGEYKEWIGADCHVYGTNAQETDLLYINPFSFPNKIHVLEHIDRLVEILNACWPMYAAMPAVLKDAIERVYVNRGWNLQKSKCCIDGAGKFPTFADLLMTLPEVMEESAYSSDTKSDYSGALMTRIKSLTNGLNGQILCNGIETSEEDLFESNVIIDLSRIGAMETRSFFMGILVMKLQEYHLSKKEMNEDLRHLTVLEEAHNLLRKTSTTQSQESSNLQGKSVEMLTNSIAEMRTYGEGFVIVDQAPGLLDEAVIRNTNTKIILRLPDAEDREVVGKSAALSDEQIKEIAKLPRGVAVVYQNNWVESVLCHFDKFEDKSPYMRKEKIALLPQEIFCERVFIDDGFKSLKSEDIDTVLAWIENSKYARETKRIMKKALIGEKLTERENQLIAYNVFNGKEIAKLLSGALTEKEGLEKANHFIRNNNELNDDKLIASIVQMIIQVIVDQNTSSDLARRYVEYLGRVK